MSHSNIERRKVSRGHVLALQFTGALTLAAGLIFGSQLIGAKEAREAVTQQHEWDYKRDAANLARAQQGDKLPVSYTANGVQVTEKTRVISAYPKRSIAALEAKAARKQDGAGRYGFVSLSSLVSLVYTGGSALIGRRRRQLETEATFQAEQAAADIVPPTATRGATAQQQEVSISSIAPEGIAKQLGEAGEATAITILGNLGLATRPRAYQTMPTMVPYVPPAHEIDEQYVRKFAPQRYGSQSRRSQMAAFTQIMGTCELGPLERWAAYTRAQAVAETLPEPATVIWPDANGSTEWAAELDAVTATESVVYNPYAVVSNAPLPSLR